MSGIGKKVYLGDGAYAEVDEWHNVILTTENGMRATNRIVLEPEVLAQLLTLIEQTHGIKTVPAAPPPGPRFCLAHTDEGDCALAPGHPGEHRGALHAYLNEDLDQ